MGAVATLLISQTPNNGKATLPERLLYNNGTFTFPFYGATMVIGTDNPDKSVFSFKSEYKS